MRKYRRSLIAIASAGAIAIYTGQANKLIELADAYYAYYFYDTGLLARPHLLRASLRNVCKRYAMEQGSGSRFYGRQWCRIAFGEINRYNFYDSTTEKNEEKNKALIIQALKSVGYDPSQVVVNDSSNPKYKTSSITKVPVATVVKPIKHWNIVPDEYKSSIRTNRR